MKICFLGTSHAARHLSQAAAYKGFWLSEPEEADLIFVSEDTPTDASGKRDMAPIVQLVRKAETFGKSIVLTSQCEPGFTRSLGIERIYHQAETLRIKDAYQRARKPEMFLVGCGDSHGPRGNYYRYLVEFECPIVCMSWEEAEFTKIAINMTLAAQVDNANRLSAAAAKAGCDWSHIAQALMLDSRIGPNAYLTPGRWQDSPHLLRDAVTLTSIEA